MIKAAQYVRMSTERQDFSLEYQLAALAAYAQRYAYTIVRTYKDEGISGVGIEKRLALKALLADVLAGTAEFSTILVYDVSRWGRFQNPDQAAHYEFICSEAGVSVQYCAEPFENDGSPTAILIKQFKRAMAAEFSRELSVKTKRGKEGLRKLGYWVSGKPGYGLRRMAVTLDGVVLGVREDGHWNSGPGQRARTRLAWGPPGEVAVVRRIFRMFLGGASLSKIAADLNKAGFAPAGSSWNHSRVRDVITNEAYAGTLVSGRQEQTLRGRPVFYPPERWVRAEGAVKPMVTPDRFKAAQIELARRKRGPSEGELTRSLQCLLQEHGQLSALLIRRHAPYPICRYERQFGTLAVAFERVGYVEACSKRKPWGPDGHLRKRRDALRPTDEALLLELRDIWMASGHLDQATINGAPGARSWAIYTRHFGGAAQMYERLGYPLSLPQQASLRSADRAPR
ncbi:recombinase family protein [Brevundimonas sp.]|jgi:DNA invertase Pin-like site-specific DNA recombinase|uniref:recombinase family protein n=1 Tax=Brevundimonas sp. TaxID=1871086 RepID=UPI002E15F9F9|nr:recombinase family protein [Brevundimonas sp.]